ncbi:AAA domain-containing protein [Candidatus Thioglobus sp.]|nr:AAA domain-containing protein [Candidatus Thioglobus sp.]
MEVIRWPGGLYPHEEVAINKMQSKFSGYGEIYPWKGYAGFRLIEKGEDAEFDIVIVTHCNVLVIELKDWNGKEITSADGRWYLDGQDRKISPVEKKQKHIWDILDPKLKRSIDNFSENKGFQEPKHIPHTHLLVVMTGNADWSKLPEIDKKCILSIDEFLRLGDRNAFNARFRPHPNSQVLNKDFHIFDNEIFNTEQTAPKSFIVDGYKKEGLIFRHPKDIYNEYDSQPEIEKQNSFLMRVWSFDKIGQSEGNTFEGRLKIATHESNVLGAIQNSSNSQLYNSCLHLRSNPQKDHITSTYSEIYELKPKHKRLNEFIDSFVVTYSEVDKLNLIKLLISKCKEFHEINISHNDLGDHSIWISPGKDISFSSFICSTSNKHPSLSNIHSILSVNEKSSITAIRPEEKLNSYQYDVRMLAIICWHIYSSKRITIDTLNKISDDLINSNHWIAPLFLDAIKYDKYKNTNEFFEQLKTLEPNNQELFDFDDFELAKFRKKINHVREFKEDTKILNNDHIEVYFSDGRLVKAWPNINPTKNDPSLSYKVLKFLSQIERVNSMAPKYLPKVFDFGLATQSSSLYVVEDLPDIAEQWDNLPFDLENKPSLINKLIEAIVHLNGLGIDHRGIHPKNVLVNIDDKGYNVILRDTWSFDLELDKSTFNEYQPDNSNSWALKRINNFAIMKMSCEILGINWGKDSTKYKLLSDAVILEIEDELTGFESLSRFQKALNKLDDDTDQIIEIFSRRIYDPITIYPDNGNIYVKFKKMTSSNDVQVEFLGVGGQLNLFYNSNSNEFNDVLKPWVKNIKPKDREDCDMKFNFAIKLVFGGKNDFDQLTKKAKNTDAFLRSLQRSLDANLPSSITKPVNLKDDLPENALNDISTSVIWKGILDTESESRPNITVSNYSNNNKEVVQFYKDEREREVAVIQYDSEKNPLEEFHENDKIEAYFISKHKDQNIDTFIGKVQYKDSKLGEIHLLKPQQTAKSLNNGDNIYFRDVLDHGSYEKRRKALERIIENKGVIHDLARYFDQPSKKTPIQFTGHIEEDDFKAYERFSKTGEIISLNDEQKAAFRLIISSGPVSALQGPPGTGKTEFIAAFTHYLFKNHHAKNILLVSQSHIAVDTASERIRLHASRLKTDLEVVRFSNNENVVLNSMKDALSGSIINEKNELFKAELKFRIESLSSALGLPKKYLVSIVLANKIFRDIALLLDEKSRQDNLKNNKVNQKKESQDIKKYLIKGEVKIREMLKNDFTFIDYKNIDLFSVKDKVVQYFGKLYNINPNEEEKASLLAKLTYDMMAKLETENTNYEEFLARSRQLVIGTCVGIAAAKMAINNNHYDWVIIDEAARSSASELAIAMQSGKRILLVGDHKQLTALYSGQSKSALAKNLGLKIKDLEAKNIYKSDFERLFESNYGKLVSSTLLTQYRMAPQIGTMVSDIFYDGKLINGKSKALDAYKESPEEFKNTVTWIDTSPLGEKSYHLQDKKTKSLSNTSEASIIINLLKRISENAKFLTDLKSSYQPNEPIIGVICMYSSQKKMIEKRFNQTNLNSDFKSLVKIGTVDSYQGKENPIIIVSMTRCEKNKTPGFLKESNRINVALSRAMDRLVIIGSSEMWTETTGSMGKTLKYIRDTKKSGYCFLPVEKDDFSLSGDNK